MRRRPPLPLLVLLGLAAAGAALLPIGRTLLADPAGPVVEPSTTAPEPVGFTLWGRDHRGGPLRWDACEPIDLVLNIDGAPADAERDVRTALALLSGASGLELQLEGSTQERPDIERPLVTWDGQRWRWNPVLVAWAAPGEGGLPLTSQDRGVALPVAVRDGDREAFVTGQVVLNARRTDLKPGFDDRRDAVGATLLHELAHLLGLDHVDDPEELMSVRPGTGPVVLGPGDLAGLRAIGAPAGCTSAPEPSAGRGLSVRR